MLSLLLQQKFSVDDKKKALKEAVRVTKKGGYIFVAYVMNDSVIVSYFFGERRIMEYKDKITEDFMCKSYVEEIFDLIRLEGIDEINKTQEIVREKIVATDGAASYMKDVIDSLTNEEYNLFLEYHLSTCERTDLIGATSHALDILIKE